MRRRRVPDQSVQGLFSRDAVGPSPDAELPDTGSAPPDPPDETQHERRILQARTLARKGRHREAVRRYRALLRRQPAPAGARVELAELLHRLGEHEEALGLIEAELAALVVGDHGSGEGADRVELLVTRSGVLMALQRVEQAEADLVDVLRQQPGHLGARFHLGLALLRRGRPTDAAEALRRVLEVEPDHAQAHYYLGEALAALGELGAAYDVLQRAAEVAPHDGRIYQLLGRILDRQRRPEEAVQMYRRARAAARIAEAVRR